jgi:RNA recognition motif-containing protein
VRNFSHLPLDVQTGEELLRKILFSDTGRSRGFGFVNLSSNEEAEKAVKDLNGHSLDSREIVVNEARPRRNRNSGESYGSSRW